MSHYIAPPVLYAILEVVLFWRSVLAWSHLSESVLVDQSIPFLIFHFLIMLWTSEIVRLLWKVRRIFFEVEFDEHRSIIFHSLSSPTIFSPTIFPPLYFPPNYLYIHYLTPNIFTPLSYPPLSYPHYLPPLSAPPHYHSPTFFSTLSFLPLYLLHYLSIITILSPQYLSPLYPPYIFPHTIFQKQNTLPNCYKRFRFC